MGQVLIRNIDDFTLASYREEAARNRRSLEAELREALMRLQPRAEKDGVALVARAKAIRAMTPTDRKQTPSEQLVREDREGLRE